MIMVMMMMVVVLMHDDNDEEVPAGVLKDGEIESDPEDRVNNGDDLFNQRDRTTVIVDKMNLIMSVKLSNERSGTREEFIDMVSRCKSVGVNIYVDGVINHM